MLEAPREHADLPYLLQEFDTPLGLYLQGGIFRGMCDRSNISLDDLHKADIRANDLSAY